MSDDMILHFSSNSSNQSDQSSKIAKLEARLVGKASSAVSAQPQVQAQLNSWTVPAKFGGASDGLADSLVDSDDSDDDDNGGAYLIQANTQKRRKVDEVCSPTSIEQVEEGNISGSTQQAPADARYKNAEPIDNNKLGGDVNKRKQSRGRATTSSGRGRGSRVSDQARNQSISPSNGQVENSLCKDGFFKEQLGHDGHTSREDEGTSLRAKVAAMEEELKKSREEVSDSRDKCERLEKELKDIKDYEQQMKPKRMKVISDLLISVSKAERQEARMRVRQDSLRLGNIGVVRAGTIISEAWEDGQAMKDINAQLRILLETKEAIERQRKSLKKRPTDKGEVADAEGGVQEEDILMQDEIFKSRLASIKREEEAVMRERDRHELEKGRLIREMKRIRDEDGSRFNNFQILHHRYALLNLLGKGGFSEVYKAFDLVEHRYVACKLHGLNAQWSEEKKQSYIRHAIREYNIHKTLVHRHIVRLWDIFEIDHNTFCTVLEYCSGKDLDAVLKATPVLPEREARIIVVQIFQGLVYLNKRSQKIIHYDLKPGNVLFDEFGVAKVTDFGLSKIVEDNVGSQGMELTSQGAGTYWYLPPECFELSRTPLISSKVDVWSLGVLLYQMLFGRRPFGHDQSQERILREDTIIKARKVEFPSRPSVSNEAKDFIRRCLTYNQAERPDVLAIAQDPYLIYTKK
ncbi:serine/threonine-protein kinase TOUSLED isoform X2 [Salvia miltiorrhiza]|uniref:serine/threonine-protein kinase TOUSLED isoform X2 n=1 Tax=Salvia miltiorrhiza TaxID=226208 RepID=UPI0025AC1B87|nr:serine/threonine-protein kinase TOUSLED isoform X2 [Salvia miltiorrhiza]XP_057808137.1 serine/threonine-protein kinase TOUSLED isoform X2 [Salvia miltiorrhiza]